MSNPDDGYAYSPIELTAIWAIPTSISDEIAALQKQYEFHSHCAAMDNFPDQKAHEGAVALIQRALLGDAINNPIPDLMYGPFQDEGTDSNAYLYLDFSPSSEERRLIEDFWRRWGF